MTRESADFLPGPAPATPPAALDRPQRVRTTERRIERPFDRRVDETAGPAPARSQAPSPGLSSTGARGTLPPDDDGLFYPLSPPPVPWPRIFPQL